MEVKIIKRIFFLKTNFKFAIIEYPHDFKFVILCSGFQSLGLKHVNMFQRLNGEKISIPSMHIIGQTDQVVDSKRSEELANDYFHNPTIVYHSGGHTIPSQTNLRSQYLNFFDKIFQNYSK